jgi:2-oxoglutarate ferredoxin oxidoreductase subunit beta
VAQVVDWIPEILYDVVKMAFHHRGLSFIRIVQRCPEWLPRMFEPWLHDASRILMLHHENGLHLSAGLASTYKTQLVHDPASIHRAREIASDADPIPVGILYRNPDVPCYEETRHAGQTRTTAQMRAGLETELDKYTVWPQESSRGA